MLRTARLAAVLAFVVSVPAAAQAADSIHPSPPGTMLHDSMMAADPAMRARHDSMMHMMMHDPAMRARHDSMMQRMMHDPAMRARHDSMMQMMQHDPAMRARHDSMTGAMEGAGAAHDHAMMHGADQDTGFQALERRGARYMGVDQSRAIHRFDALPDGGRIELQSQTGDSAEVTAIRHHFAEIARAFQAGDFSIPGMVHDQEVPGTRVMGERRDRIHYVLADLPRGAELRLVTADSEAVAAIHEFMAFQRREHHAGGRP
jgi:hypothetical protein